jgi:hypothetical protein
VFRRGSRGVPANPKRSPHVERARAQQQIDAYGRESPWVKVNVLGEFREASLNALPVSKTLRRCSATVRSFVDPT